jgi:hypothetical protein
MANGLIGALVRLDAGKRKTQRLELDPADAKTETRKTAKVIRSRLQNAKEFRSALSGQIGQTGVLARNHVDKVFSHVSEHA